MNIEKLRDVVLWVEKESQREESAREWDQSMWLRITGVQVPSGDVVNITNLCGTTCCVAGKLVIEEGYTNFEVGEGGNSHYVLWDDGIPMPIVELAAGILGINNFEAERLFWEGNSAENIRTVATVIAAAHGEIL
jgi:hypothetical protein